MLSGIKLHSCVCVSVAHTRVRGSMSNAMERSACFGLDSRCNATTSVREVILGVKGKGRVRKGEAERETGERMGKGLGSGGERGGGEGQGEIHTEEIEKRDRER